LNEELWECWLSITFGDDPKGTSPHFRVNDSVDVFNVQCAIYNVQITVFNVQFAVFNVQFAMYNAHCIIFNLKCNYKILFFIIY